MYDGREFQTRLYQLFDGILVVYGCKKLLWHGVKITNKKIQILPSYLRKYYNDYPLILRKWYKIRKKLIALINKITNKKIG